ncbi:MAG: acetyl-CoA carboxylase biotin carboxyl carrier protein [Candidatus Kerfeldbacteria bacterium]
MFTFTVVIVILAICFYFIGRSYKMPSIDTIKEIVSNSSISEIEITSKFSKIHEISYYNTDVPIHQPPVYIPPRKPFYVITSNMVGTFHLTYIEGVEDKDKKPIVFIGQIIKVGDTVGIINAMRLDIEVESEFAGMITGMLVEDGSRVEFGQPIMFVEQI